MEIRFLVYDVGDFCNIDIAVQKYIHPFVFIANMRRDKTAIWGIQKIFNSQQTKIVRESSINTLSY